MIEQTVNTFLQRFPFVKRLVKRLYQGTMCCISHQPKSSGNIVAVTPDDGKEYFFGYYDKSPWDSTGRYMLCLRAQDTWSHPDPKAEAEIVLIDTANGNSVEVLSSTKTWNVQQGCMLQWLGPDFSSKIIYNDLREGRYCSVIMDIDTRQERVIPCPIYSVTMDGKMALSLDFSRLHNLRPGYGYSALPERTAGAALPDGAAIWSVVLENGTVTELIKYHDFVEFEPRKEMLLPKTVHKVNHIMISPDGTRFIVLYRWFNGSRKYSRLISCGVDGKGMRLLSDDDMVSHCCWKNDHEILAYQHKWEGGNGYYLIDEKSGACKRLWTNIKYDGHPSYSPIDDSLVVTDSYPDRQRISTVKLLRDTDIESSGKVIAKVYSPFKYDNDTRCDLHPRWKRDGSAVCFDGVFEGHRRLYVIPL